MVVDETSDAPSLVVGQRVHRVEHQCLDAGVVLVAPAVLEQRDEEAFGLARARTGRDQRRLRQSVARREPHPRLGLMLVGPEPGRRPIEVVAPGVVRLAERGAQPNEGATEDAVMGVGDEALELGADVVVRKGEGGAEEAGQRAPQIFCDERRQHRSESPSASTVTRPTLPGSGPRAAEGWGGAIRGSPTSCP